VKASFSFKIIDYQCPTFLSLTFLNCTVYYGTPYLTSIYTPFFSCDIVINTADVVLRFDRCDVVLICGDVILKDDDVALIVCEYKKYGIGHLMYMY
jgi:hypothetical protein